MQRFLRNSLTCGMVLSSDFFNKDGNTINGYEFYVASVERNAFVCCFSNRTVQHLTFFVTPLMY